MAEVATLSIVINAENTASAQLQAVSDAADETTASLDRLSGSGDIAAEGLSTASEAGDATAASLDETAGAGAAAAPALAETGAAADEASGGFDLLGGSMIRTLAPLLALFAGYEGVKAFLSGAKKENDLFNSSQAQIINTLNQTHDAIGLTISQLDALATSSSKNTAITNASNLGAEQQLLNYKLSQPVFEQATDSIDNIATAMANAKGQAVPSSTQMAMAAKLLGTALQDPATGVNKLNRAGVELTASQQAAVKALQKSGDVIGAQTLLMQDFADATQGKAGAALDTFQGKVDYTQKILDQDLRPVLQKVQSDLEAMANSIINDLIRAYDFLKPAIDALGGALDKLMPALETFFKTYIVPISEVIGGAFIFALKLAIETFTLLVKVLTDVVNYLDKHKKGVEEVMKVIGPLVAVMAGLLIAFKVYDAFKDLQIAFDILRLITIPSLWATIMANPLLDVAILVAAVALEIVTHWNDVKKWFDDFFNWTKQHWQDILVAIAPFTLIPLIIIDHWNDVKQWFNDFINWIKTVFSAAGSWLYDAGRDLINGLIKGVEDAAQGAINAVKKVGSDIINAAKDVLHIFSPSGVFADIGSQIGAGLVQGIQGSQGSVSTASSQLATSAVTGATQTPISPISNNSNINNSVSQQVTIGQVVLASADAVQEFFDQLNRDSILVNKGLTPVQGNL